MKLRESNISSVAALKSIETALKNVALVNVDDTKQESRHFFMAESIQRRANEDLLRLKELLDGEI